MRAEQTRGSRERDRGVARRPAESQRPPAQAVAIPGAGEGSGIRGWLTLALTLALALLIPASAQALPPGYHYEMVSPPDKNYGDVGAGSYVGQYFASPDGDHLAYNAQGGWGNAGSNPLSGVYVAARDAEAWSSESLLLPMYPPNFISTTGAPAVADDFSRALTFTTLNQETGEEAPGLGGRFTYLMDLDSRDVELFSVPNQAGNSAYTIDNQRLAGNDDFSRIVYSANADLLGDGLPAGNRVYLYDGGSDRTQVSILPNGDPARGQLADVHLRPVSADAEVAYFIGQAPDTGLFRRDMSAGTTVRVNAHENPEVAPPAAGATFVGASSDGDVAYFISSQRLLPEDTENQADLYRYDHSKPAGSRLTLASVDAEPSDVPKPVDAGFGVSADGGTVFFSSASQLVEGEETGPGPKIFAYTDGELRYVASAALATLGTDSYWKLAENGETFAFVSSTAGVTSDDSGGQAQVYVYDVTGDQLACASCRPGVTGTAGASLARPGLAVVNALVTSKAPRRAVSENGQVFFQTAERLVNEDTNGKSDVYVWKDGEVALLSTGRSTDDSWFLDASADGSTAFIMTRERLSGWDRDNRMDAYAVRTGDALPEPEPPAAPCVGEDCQDPPSSPPVFTDPGSSDVDGPGNAGAKRRCASIEKRAARLAGTADRLAQKATRKAKRARRASSPRSKRLRRQANRAQRRANRIERRARNIDRRLERCHEEAGH